MLRSKTTRSLYRPAITVSMLLLQGICLQAQTNTGTISGAITDTTGASISDVQLTARNTETGATVKVASIENGSYTISSLPPGVYRVTAEKPGFKTSVFDNVRLSFSSQTALDISLSVGNVAETVEVAASAVEINNAVVEVATSIEEKAVKDLPLQIANGRRQIDAFVFLVPGVQGDTFSSRINGGVDFNSEVLFDGVPMASFETNGYQTGINPPFEAIDEFKVLTSVFSAQYGRGQGVKNYHFGQGTNALHGNAFDFVRNTAFDARGFFSPTTPVNKQNEYGFTVGGPAIIPKVYNGKDKTFFNVAVSWYKFRGAGLNDRFTVPTADFRRGDFSGLLDSSGRVIPIYDPLTRTPFPGNVIPQARFSPTSARVLPLIPVPTAPGLVNNVGPGIPSFPNNNTSWSYNLAHAITPNQRISFTQWRTSSPNQCLLGSNISGSLSGLSNCPGATTAYLSNYSWAVKPNLVVSAGTLWFRILNNQEIGGPANTAIDFPGLPRGANVAFPQMAFNGPTASPVTLGTGFQGDYNFQPGTSTVSNVLWLKGKHSFNIGFEYRQSRNTTSICEGCPARFAFSNRSTSLPGSPDFATAGHPFASFLLGIADSATASTGLADRIFRNSSYSGYIQDDYKLTSKLTLNLGLRYDVFIPATEDTNRLAFFDPTIPNPAAGGRLGALSKPGDCEFCSGQDTIADTRWKNFAPRFGFAYAWNTKTVFRGGYGIVYGLGGANDLGQTRIKTNFLNGSSGNFASISQDAGVTPGYGSWDRPFPLPVVAPFTSSIGNNQSVNYAGRWQGSAPYIQNWTVGVEREIPGSVLVTVSYVGNKGIRLPSNVENLNQVDPRFLSLGATLQRDINSPEARAANIPIPYPGFTGSVAQALRPYPQYTGITSNFQQTGVTRYEALQATVQRRFSQGLEFLVSYTASRQLSNTNSGFGTFNGGAVNTFNRAAEYGLAPSDIPHTLAVSGLYELPIGTGKRLLNKPGVAGRLIGGWQLGWVTRYQSGTPISVGASNVLPIFGGGNRPNLVRDVDPQLKRSGFDPAKDKLININAFSQPADFTFGNAPRVLRNARNFAYFNENVNVSKYFRMTETINVQFRAEFFNVFNRVVFGGANTSYSPTNAAFGTVGGQGNTPRQGQLALKLNF
ncbi:MAG: TonB-dependent receptor [Bryobacteraceae bacterium]|nr:TonB-dependent receptor [Bryobacteraceae bacterium]